MKKKIDELNKIIAQQQRWIDLSEDQQRQKIEDTISQQLFLKKLYSKEDYDLLQKKLARL